MPDRSNSKSIESGCIVNIRKHEVTNDVRRKQGCLNPSQFLSFYARLSDGLIQINILSAEFASV